jgi:hypothetical protein
MSRRVLNLSCFTQAVDVSFKGIMERRPNNLTLVGQVLFAIPFANKQIGGGHEGLSH